MIFLKLLLSICIIGLGIVGIVTIITGHKELGLLQIILSYEIDNKLHNEKFWEMHK